MYDDLGNPGDYAFFKLFNLNLAFIYVFLGNDNTEGVITRFERQILIGKMFNYQFRYVPVGN